jgi:sterol desaturase/sphingolipid hydroxylase (fatty acid hydroxylase superfamily)
MLELFTLTADYLVSVFTHLAASEKIWWTAGFLAIVLFIDLARRNWRMNWPVRMVKGIFATIGVFAINLAFLPFVWFASGEFQSFYNSFGLPHIPVEFWADVPVWVLVPLAAVLFDFANYWNHRVMHMKWLWPVHAIHHSDPDVTGLTSYRTHFLETLVMWMSFTILLSWAGFPPNVLGFAAVVLQLHNVYVHINLDWDHGPFRFLLASPRYHRWHHADVPAAYGKNLANTFPFFDVLFGTYYVPGRCEAELGAEGVPQNDVVALALFPFREWVRSFHRAVNSLARSLAVGHRDIET